jgi:hypothetical protein
MDPANSTLAVVFAFSWGLATRFSYSMVRRAGPYLTLVWIFSGLSRDSSTDESPPLSTW